MQIHPFRVSEKELDSECRELRLEGEVDLSVAGELRKRLEAAAREDLELFVCFERCDFIDSSGIAAIVSAEQRTASKGRRLFLCNVSGQVRSIFAATGITDRGLVHASVEEALAERGGSPVAADGNASSDEGSAGRDAVAVAGISREVVRIHAHLYGRGPTKAKTIWRQGVVVCVLEEMFTRAEAVLVEAGKFEQVRAHRQAFHDVIEPLFRQAIENATGCPVRSFLSQVSPEGVGCELFVLDEPEPHSTE